ncbi:MAG: four helix bundle protein [Bacteroidota bacterium]
MQNYKDLKVWEKAHSFTLGVYKATQSFPSEEKFGLISQLRRASSSIPANIAEGCGKSTNAELRHFLNIALGSANEVEYFLLLSKDLRYLPEAKFLELTTEINSIKAMLIALIGKVKATLKT